MTRVGCGRGLSRRSTLVSLQRGSSTDLPDLVGEDESAFGCPITPIVAERRDGQTMLRIEIARGSIDTTA